ncbi:glycosyltransferase family 4 protein [Sulfurovum sp.]|uniref:glycosyltransferase family 4 protein n=1 Tax=Sulfurovum sp. TaxID=1969726 RepID=UPI0035686B7A
MSKKIKILSVIETLGNGGAERVLINTLPALQKIGIECEVAILFETDDLAEELEMQGIKVHRLHLSHKWNVVEGIYKLNQLIKKHHYDIIHAHLFFAYFYTGLIKLFHTNVKTVTTFHNLGYNTYPATTFVKKLRKNLDAFVVNKLVDKKVAVSGAVRDHYVAHLNISHVDVIFNSFPLGQIDTAQDIKATEILKKYVNASKYDLFSITPGRLVKEKGHTYLLEAIERLDKVTIKLCHFIVGSGPLEEDIKSEIKEKKLLNVVLIPGLLQEDLFQFIRACDFVVVPSISEGFGMVVGEAMALVKPIVATDIDGVVDMIENNKEGLLVPAKNSEALAKAIERLYNDAALRDSLAENAKEKIKQFDTKIIAKQWKAYYEEMLRG